MGFKNLEILSLPLPSLSVLGSHRKEVALVGILCRALPILF